jgi:hypothetical protein
MLWQRAVASQQLMGQSLTAGVIYFKQGSPRSKIQVKCYVSLYICLAIKAVHLNWSTPGGCTAALWRLLTWREKCLNMHSDNRTTHAGAHHEFWELRELFASEAHLAKLLESTNSEAFTSHFIPSHSPDAGGTSEAQHMLCESLKESGRGHSIYFSSIKHSPDSRRGMSEFSPSDSFVQWSK